MEELYMWTFWMWQFISITWTHGMSASIVFSLTELVLCFVEILVLRRWNPNYWMHWCRPVLFDLITLNSQVPRHVTFVHYLQLKLWKWFLCIYCAFFSRKSLKPVVNIYLSSTVDDLLWVVSCCVIIVCCICITILCVCMCILCFLCSLGYFLL